MSETYPPDETLNALSGLNDAQQEVLFPRIGEAPYYTSFYKMLYRLLDVARRAGDLRVYKDSVAALKFGVRPGRWLSGDSAVNYAGAANQTLADNATNYIYLTATGTLTVNQSGFPVPSVTPHIPLATIATGTASAAGVSGAYAHADITDYRGRAFLSVPGASGGMQNAAEADAFFAATDISGAEAETLTAGGSSDADGLHTHALKLSKALAGGNIFVGNGSNVAAAVAMSGDATISNSGAVTISNLARSKLTEDSLARYPVSLADCRNPDSSHAPLPYVTTLNTFSTYLAVESNQLFLRGHDVSGDNEQSMLALEFALPVEYVSAGDVKLRLHARYTGSGTAGTKTIDAVAKVIGDDGAFASDLVATNAQTLTTSWADYDFVVTATNLTAGNRLIVIVTTSLTETGENNPLHAEIGAISMLLDVKG